MAAGRNGCKNNACDEMMVLPGGWLFSCGRCFRATNSVIQTATNGSYGWLCHAAHMVPRKALLPSGVAPCGNRVAAGCGTYGVPSHDGTLWTEDIWQRRGGVLGGVSLDVHRTFVTWRGNIPPPEPHSGSCSFQAPCSRRRRRSDVRRSLCNAITEDAGIGQHCSSRTLPLCRCWCWALGVFWRSAALLQT